VAAKSRLPTKIFFTSFLFPVFQLCGQDKADQGSQALAGLSKGTPSVARLQRPNTALCDDDTGEMPASLPGSALWFDVDGS
jgi:hypothetical protein